MRGLVSFICGGREEQGGLKKDGALTRRENGKAEDKEVSLMLVASGVDMRGDEGNGWR